MSNLERHFTAGHNGPATATLTDVAGEARGERHYVGGHVGHGHELEREEKNN